MKFPGKRNKKHFFPVEEHGRIPLDFDFTDSSKIYIVGLDQLLVDIEIPVTDEFLIDLQIPKGQSSVISDDLADKVYNVYKQNKEILGEYPGGSIGNTLHNYSILSDGHSIALGAINKNITVGDYAYRYLVNTSALVDLSYLSPSDVPMGRALCFISPDRERTFAISKGCMDLFGPESVPDGLIKNASALLVSAYTLRDPNAPIFKTTVAVCKEAKAAGVPVVMSLGTSFLVKQHRTFLREFISEYANVLSMNQLEAFEYTQIEDPLLALEALLNDVDLAMVTVGSKGLYMGGNVDREFLRLTQDELVSKSIKNYNEYEYSRPMVRSSCKDPVKVYSHINPFMGGPAVIKNTNGAGDAALAAILHDIAANQYHRLMMPSSPKHRAHFLSYSSIAQLCKYANRVSFEVLRQNSPRLLRGLPQREAALEESYWDK